MEDYFYIILFFLFISSATILTSLILFLNFIYNPFLEKINDENKAHLITKMIPSLNISLKINSILLIISSLSLLLISLKNINLHDIKLVINICIITSYLIIYYLIQNTRIGKNILLLTFLYLTSIGFYIFILNKYLLFDYSMTNLFIFILLQLIVIINLWLKISPSINNIISSINLKNNPKTDDVGKYKLYLRHNAYASLISLWTLINFLIGINVSILFTILSINVLILLVFITSRRTNG